MANGVTPRPNYQGGDISIAPYLQGITNVILANQQQAQAKAQAEQERADKLYDEVQKLATKVNPSGILPDDYDDFMSIYQNGIKKNMIDAMLARQNGDMKTYTAKIAKANEEIANANYLTGRSKGRMEEYSKFFLNFNPKDFSDEAPKELARLMSIPTLKLKPTDTLIGNPVFMRKVDTSKVQGQIDSVLDDLFKNSAKLSGINPTRVMAGGRGADVVQFEEAIDKNVFAESVEMRFASDPAWRAFAEQNNLGKTPEEAAINLTAAYEAAGRFQRTDGRQIVRDQALSQSGGTQTPGDISLTYGAPVHFGPNNNSRIVTGKSATLDVKNKSIEGADGVDLTTGQRTAVPSGTYSVTGVYAMPVLNRDIRYKANPSAPTTTIKAGNFATGGADGSPTSQDVTYKDFIIVMNESKNLIGETTTKRYAIPRDRLPSSLLADNKIKAAVSAYDQTPVAPGYKQESPQNSVSLTDNSTKPKLSW